jgi:hypothetical protein
VHGTEVDRDTDTQGRAKSRSQPVRTLSDQIRQVDAEEDEARGRPAGLGAPAALVREHHLGQVEEDHLHLARVLFQWRTPTVWFSWRRWPSAAAYLQYLYLQNGLLLSSRYGIT